MFTHGGASRLQAKSPKHWLVKFRRPYNVRAARYAVPIVVIRISQRQNIGSGDRFEQSKANHLRRNAGAQHGLGMKWPITQIGGAVAGLSKGGNFATGERHRYLFIVDLKPILRPMPGQAEVLHLCAVGRLWKRRQVPFDLCYRIFRCAGNGHPKEHRD